MSESAKILMVEDDMIIAADISMQITKMGYEVIGIATRGEDALKTLENASPDIILMDIMLSGEIDGIQTAASILNQFQIPVIFLTSNSDEATFQRAIKTKPYAFIAKPFQKADLERTLKLVNHRIQIEKEEEPTQQNEDHLSSMDDRFFIRHKNELVKVMIADICYIEADRTYCKLITKDQNYTLSVPLKQVESQLPDDLFVRTHRSFVANLKEVDSIGENNEYLSIGGQQIPVSRRLKEEVLKRLRLI